VEELDDITLCRELEVLGTRESNLDHREADLDREWKALGDACTQILACQRLRDLEARPVAWVRQLAERQMQELALS
jgi:hypothetical protein